MSERLRLFVAVDLPRDVRAELAGWAAGAAPAEVRRVPEQNLHLTLAFLGSRSREEADAVAALLPVVAAPVGELRTAGALWLPPRRPGVLAVALAGMPQLEALQRSLVGALADAVGHEPEHRRFRPHVTVARVRRGRRGRATDLSQPPASTFEADALTLYRSLTGPGGSRYEPLARAVL
ncbi:MAG: RNA 2',3'-cyclic phosphodiesterase [Actinomycetota bacterium]|nr:RNA 2',3'-cyclic phosphodiesterase [Actinomycetota bacterium]